MVFKYPAPSAIDSMKAVGVAWDKALDHYQAGEEAQKLHDGGVTERDTVRHAPQLAARNS